MLLCVVHIPFMHKTILIPLIFELKCNWNKIPHTSLNMASQVLNLKLFQFHPKLTWVSWKFHGLSKYHLCKIWIFQKGPQIFCFLAVFYGKGPPGKCFISFKGVFINLPFVFFLLWTEGAAACCCLRRRLPPHACLPRKDEDVKRTPSTCSLPLPHFRIPSLPLLPAKANPSPTVRRRAPSL